MHQRRILANPAATVFVVYVPRAQQHHAPEHPPASPPDALGIVVDNQILVTVRLKPVRDLAKSRPDSNRITSAIASDYNQNLGELQPPASRPLATVIRLNFDHNSAVVGLDSESD